jgi:D-alanyl-D-alanine carboxypeptidase
MNEQIKFFGVFVLAGTVVGGLSFFVAPTPPVPQSAAIARFETLPAAISAFDTIALSARAAFVQDGATGEILFAHNADVQLPLASLTKVMAAVTALSLAPRYALISTDHENEAPRTLTETLSYALTASSNGAIAAVAAAVNSFVSTASSENQHPAAFISAMNTEARRRGLDSFVFLNETGLDETLTLTGGSGSARDIARLMLSAATEMPEIWDATTHEEGNTNKIVREIPLLRASKTGFTDLAGGNLSIVFDVGVGKPMTITVLGSTEEGRFEDVQRLIAATLRHLSRADTPL